MVRSWDTSSLSSFHHESCNWQAYLITMVVVVVSWFHGRDKRQSCHENQCEGGDKCMVRLCSSHSVTTSCAYKCLVVLKFTSVPDVMLELS